MRRSSLHRSPAHRSSLRRSHRSDRRLRFQSLEDRSLLAGDMNIFVAGGNLFIFGDSAANEIQLERDGSGAITISSLDGTTELNGQTGDLTFGNVTRGIFIYTKGGDDVVRMASGGADPFRVNGVLHINTAGGNDTIEFDNVEVAKTMVLLTGKGDDKVLTPGGILEGDTSGETGVVVKRVSVIVTGKGNDQVGIANSEFNKTFVLVACRGDDQVLVRDSTFNSHAILIGNSGNDSLSNSGNTFAKSPVIISFENQGDFLAPTANNDAATVAEGGNQAIDVADNDFDPDGSIDPTSIVIVTGPANGTATANADGTVTYTHNGSDTTSDSFTYTIKDTSGKTSNTATVSITITPDNDPPVANADSAAVNEGASVAINVASNDTDPEGNGTINLGSIVIVTGPANGTAVPNADGTVTYTHNGSETTSDSFTYTIQDNTGATSNTATVTITITPINDPPVANNDSGGVNEGSSVVINVASNDTDPEGNGTINLGSIVIVTPPANGTAVPNADGTVTYTHNGSETTGDSFTYTIQDNTGATSNVATVTITITPVNDPPVAGDDSTLVAVGNTVLVNLVANDADADGTLDLSTITIITPPANGSLIDNGDGTVSYTHDGSATTSDSFTYTIDDNLGGTSNIATVSITINATNDLPVANDDNAVVDEGASVLIDLAINDTDTENQLLLSSIVIVSPPTNGSLVDNGDGTFTYTHDGSETTSDSFTYTIDDAQGATSNTATVTITINPINDPPIANPDGEVVDEGQSVQIDLAGNDTDAETSIVPGSIVIVTPPANGTLVDNGDGTFTYTHDGSETTSDSFTYTIEDTDGNVSAPGTVSITINPINDDPVANDDSTLVAIGNTVLIDVAANDTDADNALDLNSIEIVDSPLHGSLTINGDGTVSYTHDGGGDTSDSFTYTIKDNLAAVSNTATVSITINATNNPPVANDDGATVDEGAGVLIDLAGNDTDTENQLLPGSIVITNGPANGSLVNNGDGTFTYTHDGSETTGDSFTYTIQDAQGATSNEATVTITVTPVNDDPVANDDNTAVGEALVVLIDLAGNDTDAENGLAPGSIVITNSPAHGTLINNGDGSFTYTHDGSETTSDSFTYTIQDDQGGTSNEATVTITITSINDPPVATDDNDDVTENSGVPASGNVLDNDTDGGDGGALSVAEVGGVGGNVGVDVPGLYGTFHINGDGSYTYTLNDANGDVDALNDLDTLIDSIAYTVSDGADTDGGLLSVTINGVTDP